MFLFSLSGKCWTLQRSEATFNWTLLSGQWTIVTASMKRVLFPELSTELANRDSYTCHWNSFSDAGIICLLQELSAAGILCLLQGFFVFCKSSSPAARILCLLQKFFDCWRNSSYAERIIFLCWKNSAKMLIPCLKGPWFLSDVSTG